MVKSLISTVQSQCSYYNVSHFSYSYSYSFPTFNCWVTIHFRVQFTYYRIVCHVQYLTISYLY